jgi:DNA repair exonuclease SbcCD ATPase subunit
VEVVVVGSNPDDRVMLSARVPAKLKAFVDADDRSNQEVIEVALLREFGGEKNARIDQRLEEIDRRMANIRSERNERERQLDELREDKERLQEAKEQADNVNLEYAKTCAEKLAYLPESADDPAVQNWAGKADMNADKFYQLLSEVFDDA